DPTVPPRLAVPRRRPAAVSPYPPCPPPFRAAPPIPRSSQQFCASLRGHPRLRRHHIGPTLLPRALASLRRVLEACWFFPALAALHSRNYRGRISRLTVLKTKR